MATKVTAARLLVLDAADRLDAGRRCDLEAGMAKLFASEIAMQVALDALRVHGGSAHPPEGPPPAPRLWLVTAFLPAPQGVRRQYVAKAGVGSDPSSAKPGANPVPRGGRSAGGGGPVGGDPLLRLGQRHRRGRPDGGRVARPADRRADGRLGDRRVGRAG